ncbi:MAG: AMP-binding protein [Acidimicrobiia bacterium]
MWELREPPPEVSARYEAEGLWDGATLPALLDADLRAGADSVFRIWSSSRSYEGTVGAVADLGRRFAAGLSARGIGTGDVVAFQLPNWKEAAATFWGLAHLGAVLVPVVHFYGPHELGYILTESGARALVTTTGFGHLDYRAGFESLGPTTPDLGLVVVVGGEGTGPPAERFVRDGVDAVAFDELSATDPMERPADVDPCEPAVIGYTSGTTAAPKGVIHTHRTITAEARQLASIQARGDRAALVGAPVAHAIGMLAGLLLPLRRGQDVHLADVWDPGMVLAGMLEADLTAGSGSTFFCQSLIDHPDFGQAHLDRMRFIGLGGSPVPDAVTDRLTDLGISATRSYGSTEHPSTTGSTHDAPVGQRCHTDGIPLEGVEVRIVDEHGEDVATGTPGEVWSRGPDLFGGYTDPALTEAAITSDGWYRTGDIGVLDGRGALTITDRLKDVIIRGGENVSPAEVEDLLARMPGVVEVAVVAAPDERLGEHACAFVRMLPEAPVPDLAAVRSHLGEQGLARQKWPEDLRVVDDLPRTPTGKVKKYELREMFGG